MKLRIRDWSRHFENSESRKLITLKWVAMPNRMSTQGYTALVDHPNAAAHLGAWCAIVEICSAREPREMRGTLPEADGTIGGISRVLGRISRLPASVFEELLPRLIYDSEILWIEDFDEYLGKSPDASGKSPDLSGANSRGGEGRGGEGIVGEGTTSTVEPKMPPLPCASEYPLTLTAIREHDPAADPIFVARLVQETIQHCLSSREFPQEKLPKVTDSIIARCVGESYRTKPDNHGTGLLLRRVPNIIVTGFTNARTR